MESTLKKYIEVASKKKPADLVIKHAKIVNVFTKEIMEKDVAIYEGMIVGIGEYEGKSVHNANGQYLVPGFIDGHVHIESSLLSPSEFSKVSLLHGVTTLVTDPPRNRKHCWEYWSSVYDRRCKTNTYEYFLYATFLCTCHPFWTQCVQI